jgi:DnaK suppressor protein
MAQEYQDFVENHKQHTNAHYTTTIQEEQITIPSNYSPIDDNGEYMNKKQLAYFKQILQVWRESLISKTKETMEYLSEDSIGRRSSEEGDLATEEVEILTGLRTRDRYRKLVHKIDQALLKIETGEYGYCEESGEEIGINRLLARPIATLCIAMQHKHEQEEDRKEEAEYNHEIITEEEANNQDA